MTFHQQSYCFWNRLSCTVAIMFVLFVRVAALFSEPELPDDYETLSALKKQMILWNIIESEEGTQTR
jgi:hypothetical protein